METIETGLRELGSTPAPATLAPSVLDELGLGLSYAGVETAVGAVFVAWGAAGVAVVRPAATGSDFEALVVRETGRRPRPAREVPASLASVLAPGAPDAALQRLGVDLGRLTGFQREVLVKTREIPRGEVRTYGWVAKEIGRPAAVRAVGTALARNPVPLVIPCHRVLRGNWRVGQYSCGGPAAKRAVLSSEGVDPDRLEALAGAGVRYVGSDTTRIFCVPTCRHARRVLPAHLVSFRGEADARGAGYRPCSVCRPVAA
ncbi:MAG: methylated-DNA--[protein]-cysteine S-methyltransferase [Candidatus Dormibacterales bacterium]